MADLDDRSFLNAVLKAAVLQADVLTESPLPEETDPDADTDTDDPSAPFDAVGLWAAAVAGQGQGTGKPADALSAETPDCALTAEGAEAAADERARLACAEEWRDWNAEQRAALHGTHAVRRRLIAGHKAHWRLERRPLHDWPGGRTPFAL